MKLSNLPPSPGRTAKSFLSLLILCTLIFSPAAPVSARSPSTPALAPTANAVRISQVYGGGGNSGATYTNDFIELFNSGTDPVSLTGWSVQYASSAGTTWQKTDLSGTIAAGGYYLVQQAQGAGGTISLPSPDAAGTIAMGASAGKIALANNSTLLTGSCPAGLVDFVGFGSATNCSEGSAPTPNLSNTTAALRASNGCTDTDNNAADFSTGTPTPRNSASPANVCGAPPADTAPSVGSTTPIASATGVAVDANITVTFSEDVNLTGSWFTLSCSLSGSKTAAVSGGPSSFTLNPDSDFSNSESCTLTVLASQVSDVDANDPPDVMASDFTLNFTVVEANICELAYTPIYSIQGSGLSAAITGTVTTQGIVVGDFETTTAGLGGFYMQDFAGDGNSATSDGIFVYTGSSSLVSTGEVVRVTGYARERFNMTALNGTNDNNAAVPAANITICGSGSAAPVDISMPFPDSTYLERFEGMLVRFPQALMISEYFDYDRYGEMVLALPLDGEPRPFTGTALDEPGAAALARAQANSLRRITLDDGLGSSNPSVTRHPNGNPFSLENRFRGGDTVQNATGVLSYDFSKYRIQPTAPADYTAANLRPAAPAEVGGIVRVAAMNTLNYFLTLNSSSGDKCGPLRTLVCRGADSNQPTEFPRQRAKLLAALAGLDADVIGLNEIENTAGVDPLADIVAGLNALTAPGTYSAINTGTIGTDAIKVGLIYRPAAVQPVGSYQILDSSDDPRFIDTRNRPSLAQTFEDVTSGERFTVVVNHLKSKGSACTGDPDLGDGAGNCNITRTQAAQALVDWLATDPTGSGDPDFLIMGDLNSYTMEDPVDAILAGPDDILGTADDYTNLIAAYQGRFAYSYAFDGQLGYLDHALANASLAQQVTGVTDWHINADEPDLLDYDTSFKSATQDTFYEANGYRSSDHDAVVLGLDFYDRSEHPESYGPAAHLWGGPRLGSLWHSGFSVLSSGTNDGVVLSRNWQPGPAGGHVRITVTHAEGWVTGWVDWNQDGDFEDADEQIFFDQYFSTGEVREISFDLPLISLPNTFSARFRVYDRPQMQPQIQLPAPVLPPSGTAGPGEVEDYRWNFGPTAVGLYAFQAAARSLGWAWLGVLSLTGLLVLGGLLTLRRKRSS